MTGGTGYIGRSLAASLIARGHTVHVLIRRGSETKLPNGCKAVPGDALDQATYREAVRGCDTLVHLVGVAHPSPAKAAEFRAVDLVSIQEAVKSAVYAQIKYFVYVSVAHPAPVMKAYIEVRSQGEALIRSAGLDATILRPWYVIGPGHRWPLLLLPVYRVLELLPSIRESARRLGLVTLREMTGTLVDAVENPARGVRVIEVPEIRRFAARQ